MSEIVFTFSKIARMREDVMEHVLHGLSEFASTQEMGGPERDSFLKALSEWLDGRELAPPGTWSVYLEHWLIDESRRQMFLRGLSWIEDRWQDLMSIDHYEYLREIGALNLDGLKRAVTTANLAPVGGEPDT